MVSIKDIFSLKNRFKNIPYIKSNDYWSTVIVYDWLSIIVVEFVLKFLRGKIFPDHLTALSILFFSSGIFVLYVFNANYISALLFYISIVMDCADGKLARAINLRSKHGGYVDAMADCFNQGIGFVLIGVWLIKTHENYYAATAIFLFSLYIVMAHINNIQIMVGNKKRSTACLNSRKMVGVNPWLKNPISVVEVSFIVIPYGAMLFPDNNYIIVIGFIVFILGVIFSGGRGNEDNQ